MAKFLAKATGNMMILLIEMEKTERGQGLEKQLSFRYTKRPTSESNRQVR